MFDYQFVVNPAYNRDRGPVSIGAITPVHAEFLNKGGLGNAGISIIMSRLANPA
jgi:hypothetical protein